MSVKIIDSEKYTIKVFDDGAGNITMKHIPKNQPTDQDFDAAIQEMMVKANDDFAKKPIGERLRSSYDYLLRTYSQAQREAGKLPDMKMTEELCRTVVEKLEQRSLEGEDI